MTAARRPRRIPSVDSPFPPPLLPRGDERLHVGDGPSREPDGPEVEKGETSQPQNDPTSEDQNLPKYLTLEPKTVRVRGDQLKQLTDLRREVAKVRTDKTERLTDNTFVRIALDFLFAHADSLAGNTEEELRASLLGPGGPGVWREGDE